MAAVTAMPVMQDHMHERMGPEKHQWQVRQQMHAVLGHHKDALTANTPNATVARNVYALSSCSIAAGLVARRRTWPTDTHLRGMPCIIM
jgi:hypothetical protein